MRGKGGADEIIESFLGPVLVNAPVFFSSDGAIERSEVRAVWTWLVRDVDENLQSEAIGTLSAEASARARGSFCNKVAKMIASTIEAARENEEFARRVQIQLGGQQVFDRLPQIEQAFRNQQLLAKAVAFGQAINGVRDDASLKLALESFPVDDPAVTALMMQAALGMVRNPNRLVGVVVELSDGETQNAITRAGYAPVIEAILAHAQNQIFHFTDAGGTFADIDLICRAMERYHRMVRALLSITEGDKGSRWAEKVAILVREMSELIEPRLARIDADVRQSLRKPRSGPDRLDTDMLLDALNGLYLLAAAREARDALALNSLISTLWSDVGKVLEILVSRNLEAFKQEPDNDIVAHRLNTGIKMAEIRFNPEYADILVRARDGAMHKRSA